MLFVYQHAYAVSLPAHHTGKPPIKNRYWKRGDPRESLDMEEDHYVVFADYLYRIEGGNNGMDGADVLVRVAEGIDDTKIIVRHKKQDDFELVGRPIWHYEYTDPYFYEDSYEGYDSPWTVDYVTRQLRRNKQNLWKNCIRGPIGIKNCYGRKSLADNYPRLRIVETIERYILEQCNYAGKPDVDRLYDDQIRYHSGKHSPKEVVVENVCDALIEAYDEYLFA